MPSLAAKPNGSVATPAADLVPEAAISRVRMPEPTRLSVGSSAVLDAARGLAALRVLLRHCRNIFFADFVEIAPGNVTPPTKALYFVTGLGHEWVLVFFVLGGFFISSSVFRNFARPRWSWRTYALDRSTRLYVVLIPGLLLGFLWDQFGIRNSPAIYRHPLAPFGSSVPAHNIGLTTLLGNLSFLQTRLTPVWGSNGPLWSLFNEFWYYVLFPALVGAVVCAMRRQTTRMLCTVSVAALALLVLQAQAVGFLVWLAGCGVAISRTNRVRERLGTWARGTVTVLSGGGFCFSLIYARLQQRVLGSDLAVGLSFALFLFCLLTLDLRPSAGSVAAAKAFAGFSYSLYILHFPFLFFLRSTLLPNGRWQPDGVHAFYGLCVAGAALLYAYAVAQLTETKTSSVRARLAGLF